MTMRMCCSMTAFVCGVLIGASPTESVTAGGSPSWQPSSQPRYGWNAGVARIQVTPTEPIFMKGYGSRTKPSEGVRQDLYVKALALRDETGAVSVLVTSDLHSYTRRMSDTIAQGVHKKYGL